MNVLQIGSQWLSVLLGGPTLKAGLKRAVRALYPWTGLRFVLNRNELPYILNAMDLLGEGVEVGVQRGLFAEQILLVWKGKRLYCVDPWRAYSEGDYRDRANVTQVEHEANLAEACKRLGRFGERVAILRMESLQAAPLFRDGQLDFVYLDARHDYKSVAADVRAWSPKVRRGGILAGHDYLDGVLPEGEFGVKTAVREFAVRYCLGVRTSLEPGWPSWFVQL